MYLHVLDENEGALVSRQTPGSSDVHLIDGIDAAIRALDHSPGRLGLPKIHLYIADPQTPSPDAAGRDRLASTVKTFQSQKTNFALVTTSGIARATLAVMKLLIPRNPKQNTEGFASTPAAIEWLEATRPNARTVLARLLDRLNERYERETVLVAPLHPVRRVASR